MSVKTLGCSAGGTALACIDAPLLLAAGGRLRTGACSAQDAEDIRACLGGERERYRCLIERHRNHVSALMWRFARDPVVHRELVHDVFVEGYLSLGTYKAKAPFEHWISRVAVRVGYKYWTNRKREAARRATLPEGIERLADPRSSGSASSQAAEALHGLLEQLPPRDRLALTLYYFDGYSMEEIAERTGWSVTMVKVQMWRARKRLKKVLRAAGGSDYE